MQADTDYSNNISIHALHEESDRIVQDDIFPDYISIHALHEESDLFVFLVHFDSLQFQSTLSMRRATVRVDSDCISIRISIHALHEESDIPLTVRTFNDMKISIHALHEESDHLTPYVKCRRVVDFNPRSP